MPIIHSTGIPCSRSGCVNTVQKDGELCVTCFVRSWGDSTAPAERGATTFAEVDEPTSAISADSADSAGSPPPLALDGYTVIDEIRRAIDANVQTDTEPLLDPNEASIGNIATAVAKGLQTITKALDNTPSTKGWCARDLYLAYKHMPKGKVHIEERFRAMTRPQVAHEYKRVRNTVLVHVHRNPVGHQVHYIDDRQLETFKPPDPFDCAADHSKHRCVHCDQVLAGY